jgi:hypothetical protein
MVRSRRWRKEMEYELKLNFELDAKDADHDELVVLAQRLGDAGCTDALVGLSLSGKLELEFIRQAGSAEDAFLSAMADVRRAVPGARLVGAGLDFAPL